MRLCQTSLLRSKNKPKYTFVYLDDLLAWAKPVNLEAKKLPLTAFLNLVFKDQPYTYLIQKETILVKAKVPTPQLNLDTAPPPSPALCGDATGNL